MYSQHDFQSQRGGAKGKIVNTGLVIASAIFSLVALEVGLRVYQAGWVYRFDKWAWNYQFINFRNQADPTSTWRLFTGSKYPVVFDAELGWVPKQDAQPNDNPWGTTVTIVEDGIRSNGDVEVQDVTKPILAVGDSYTFGDEVSDWETWPAQLQKLSGRRVINGGVFGYGIDQAFLRARELLSRYQFSTVIFSFILDDIHRCQLSERTFAGKPYFDFKDGRLTLENVPVPPPSREESKLLVALEHSLVAHAVMKRLFPEWWLVREVKVQNEEKGMEVACSLLHELETLTQMRGSELIVLIEYTPGEEFSASASMAVKNVLSCLSNPATRVLDLRLALSELAVKDPSRYNRLYRTPGGHMGPEGNEFVAREIAKSVNEKVVPEIHQSGPHSAS
jgi:hypothetical protein